MKKIAVLVLTLAFLLLLSTMAWGLNTPEVIEDHGVITGRYVNDIGVIAGAEYGFASKLAITADIGENDYSRVGLQYEVDPNLAVVLGLLDVGPSRAFLGIIGSTSLSEDLQGILQTDLSIQDNNLSCVFELGIKLNLGSNIDIRGGVMGIIDDSQTTTNLELGIGYRF